MNTFYGPDKDNPKFYSKLECLIQDTLISEVIIGDWNLVMDPSLTITTTNT